MTRRRIDAVLFDRGFFPSRERARAAVLAGEVRVAGEVVTKAGHAIDAAYGLRRRADWREVFGRASEPYPRDYAPRPDYLACGYCAFRDICPSSVAR